MKFTIDKKELQQVLNPLQRLSNNKSIIPILKAVQITFEDNAITAIAADDDIAIKSRVLIANQYKKQTILVDLKMLSDITKVVNVGDIDFEIKGNTLHIKQNKLKYKIILNDNEQFPTFDFTSKNAVEFNLLGFKKALEKVQHCIGRDNTRMVLTGVYCDFRNQTVIATDSFRASKAMIFKYDLDSIVITTSLISELKRIEDEIVEIEIKNKQVLLQTGNVTILSKTIDGVYPNYDAFFPKREDCESNFKVNVKEFILALEHVSLFKNEGITLINMNVVDNQLEIETKTREIGESKEMIEIQLNGEPIVASFNAEFMLQALKQVSNIELDIHVLNNRIVFADTNAVHLIVQIKVH